MAPQPLRQPRKLKDSCSSCSLSKVRCTKEKPTCARCARRNLVCGYGVSRRTGRHPCPPSPTDSCESPSAPVVSGLGPGQSASPSSITYRPGPGPGQGSDTEPSPGRRARQGSEASRLLGTGANEDGASSPQGAKLSAATGDPGAAGQAGSDPEAGTPHSATTVTPHPPTPFVMHASDLSPSALGDDLGADIWGAFDARFGDVPTPPWMMDALLEAPSFVSTAEASAPPAAESCCLGLLLQTLAQLFATPPAGCQLASLGAGRGAAAAGLPTTTTRSLGRVLADNKETIAKISQVLSCPHCAEDGYILSVATMALYKTMSWYTVAAHGGCGQPDGAAPPWSLTEPPGFAPARPFSAAPLDPFAPGPGQQGGEPEAEPSRAGAARQVVSELHQVASLVQSLSQCLQNLRQQGAVKGRAEGAGRTVAGHEGAAMDPALLAAPLAEGLEHDLRQRFRSVSANVLGILRQG